MQVTFKVSHFYRGQDVLDFPKPSAEQWSIILPSLLLCQLRVANLVSNTKESLKVWGNNCVCLLQVTKEGIQ